MADPATTNKNYSIKSKLLNVNSLNGYCRENVEYIVSKMVVNFMKISRSVTLIKMCYLTFQASVLSFSDSSSLNR